MSITPSPATITSLQQTAAPTGESPHWPDGLVDSREPTSAACPLPAPVSNAEEITTVLPRRFPRYVAPLPPGAMPAQSPALASWPGPNCDRKGSALYANPNRTWALMGVIAAVVVGLVVNVVVAIAVLGAFDARRTTMTTATASPSPTTTTTTSPPLEEPIVPMDALSRLLLDAATVNAIEGTTGIRVQPEAEADLPYDLPTDRPECAATQAPALKAALQNSGWLALQTQLLRDDDHQSWDHIVHNAVIYYPTARAASDYAAKQAAQWPTCSGQAVTITPTGEQPSTWSVGPVSHHNGILAVTSTQEGGAGWACQRALTVRNNIVIDTRSCGFNRTIQAVTLAGSIAAQVSSH
ncbi:sensor domain-containing protein [Mycobacterium riyadhense]|uniref:sensor domain-containing protein n=1 Tax=Mycobacterium riyadhense TaxID=486698 RepID=UPI001959E16F|nr:sensor domain-containing protein [Mycobacterium riyadhense]